MNSEKIAQFVAKLLRDTQESRLSWSALDPGVYRKSYATQIEDRLLILTHERNAFGEPIALKVFNDVNEPAVYTFVGVPGLDDLYETAAYSAADIDGFIDKVLKY